MARLLSVNVGRPQQIAARHGRALMSAIGKAPVSGRVRVAGVNVAGDDQADRTVHGGPDKAVYAYASEDTAWWIITEGELGAGDQVDITHRPSHGVTIAQVSRAILLHEDADEIAAAQAPELPANLSRWMLERAA